MRLEQLSPGEYKISSEETGTKRREASGNNNPVCRPLVNGSTGKKLNSSQDVEGTEFLIAWRQGRIGSPRGVTYNRKTSGKPCQPEKGRCYGGCGVLLSRLQREL